MEKLTNDEFINFLESYGDFLIPVSEMTKSHTGISLIEDDLKLYSLDDIVFSNFKNLNNNLPRPTDTFYIINKNGKMELYLMEFKFMNLEDSTKDMAKLLFNQYKREYSENKSFNEELFNSFMEVIEFEFEFADIEDYEVIARQLFDRFKIEFDKNQTFNDNHFRYYQKIFNSYENGNLINIIFKVIETLNIIIPELYEKYCIDNNIPIKDIREYLRNIDKRFVLVMGDDGSNMQRIRVQSKGHYLNNQLKRLVRGKIIDDFQIITNYEFKHFIEMYL